MNINKDNYITLLNGITKIVNNVDPFDLINGGAPQDEYAFEIQKILLCFAKISTKQELKTELTKIFNDAFELAIEEKKLNILVSAIFEQSTGLAQ